MKKKTKKIILLTFTFLLLFIVITPQIYYRIKYQGNLVVYINNESVIDFAAFEVFIDESKVLEEKVTNKYFHCYNEYSFGTSLCNHIVTIKVNGEVIEEIKVNNLLVTFITIEYYGNIFNIPDLPKRKQFNIVVEKFPLFFIA